jgi:hypothetical protein
MDGFDPVKTAELWAASHGISQQLCVDVLEVAKSPGIELSPGV